MVLIKKVATAGAVLLLIVAATAALGWKLVQHRIASHERAPQLVRIHQAPDDFAFRTLDGNVEHLRAAKGKVVFVDLWGTWCIQCVAEMPTVQKLYDRYRNDPDVRFLVISRMDSRATVRRFALMHRYDLPFYTMNDEDIPASMHLNRFPATFLYARDGSLAAEHTGAADWSSRRVVAFIDGLRGESVGQ